MSEWVHIPDFWILSNHPCLDKVVPECIELGLMRRLVEAASAVWNPFGDFLFNGNGCHYVHDFVSTYELFDERLWNVEVPQLSLECQLPVEEASNSNSRWELGPHSGQYGLLEVGSVGPRTWGRLHTSLGESNQDDRPQPTIVSTSVAVEWFRKNLRNVRSSQTEQERIGWAWTFEIQSPNSFVRTW